MKAGDSQEPRAIGAADVRLASWWGKSLPRRRSVAGLRGRPATLGLRHGPDSYGRQQWGILDNGRKPDPAMPRVKELYNPKAFITHAALLDQACAHCPIFPTAASRRSLGRVSVPVWLIILSDQLRIVALVSFYLTNKLILRGLILRR